MLALFIKLLYPSHSAFLSLLNTTAVVNAHDHEHDHDEEDSFTHLATILGSSSEDKLDENAVMNLVNKLQTRFMCNETCASVSFHIVWEFQVPGILLRLQSVTLLYCINF